MTGRSDATCAWYSQQRQWLGLISAFVLLALAIAALVLGNRARSLEAERSRLVEENHHSNARHSSLNLDLEAYREMVAKYAGQKETLASDILKFQEQIDLLNQNTKDIGAVKAELDKLEGSLADYKKTESMFLANLELLEKDGRKVGGAQ